MGASHDASVATQWGLAVGLEGSEEVANGPYGVPASKGTPSVLLMGAWLRIFVGEYFSKVRKNKFRNVFVNSRTDLSAVLLMQSVHVKQ